ncbi:methyl-accepting chemotaxis protein [Aliivibrio wodanis]|uniref:methyl-accepting chemotaxis protein n=1 Tax=Aliivibrio wodanis TaxID=80852 RepID=UPI00406D461E
MSVRKKLLSAFSSIVALIIFTGVIISFQLTKAEDVAKEIEYDDVPGAQLYLILIDEAGDVYRDTLKMIAGINGAQQSFNANINEFNTALQALIPLENAKASDRENMRKIEQYMSQYQQRVTLDILPKLTNIHTIEDQKKIYDVFDKVIASTLTPLEELLDIQSQIEKEDAEKSLTHLVYLFDWMEVVLIALTIITAIFASIIAYVLSNSITNRLTTLDHVSKCIAEGDLTLAPIEDNSGDELANLATSVNSMQNSLRELLGSISSVGSQVKTVTSDLSQVSQNVVKGATEQANKATLIATASEELSLTIGEVAQQSVSTSDLAKQSGESAHHGRKVIGDMVGNINQVSVQMEQMSIKMSELDQRSDEIGSVIKVIEDIAGQTNLLALNAAIEAARAGETGRGFAVVADEVRALAERTTKATQKVGAIIQAIQSGTRDAVNVTQESQQLVEAGSAQSSGASDALNLIVSSTDDVQHMIQSIATATEEQTAVTKEIAMDITIISDISEQSLELAAQSSNNIQSLENKVTELETLLARFRLV